MPADTTLVWILHFYSLLHLKNCTQSGRAKPGKGEIQTEISLAVRMQLMLDPFFPAWGLVPRSTAKSEEKTGPELDYVFVWKRCSVDGVWSDNVKSTDLGFKENVDVDTQITPL